MYGIYGIVYRIYRACGRKNGMFRSAHNIRRGSGKKQKRDIFTLPTHCLVIGKNTRKTFWAGKIEKRGLLRSTFSGGKTPPEKMHFYRAVDVKYAQKILGGKYALKRGLRRSTFSGGKQQHRKKAILPRGWRWAAAAKKACKILGRIFFQKKSGCFFTSATHCAVSGKKVRSKNTGRKICQKNESTAQYVFRGKIPAQKKR